MRGATEFVFGKKGKNLIVAEIGIRTGEHAIDMLNRLDIKEFYLIDHFLPYDDGGVYQTKKMQDEYYRQMFYNLRQYFSQIMFITRPSKFAVELFSDNFFDFIYIDGDHEYESVKFDIENWYRKVKVGGYLGGHDYSWQGVKKALDEFPKKAIYFKDADWIIKKTL